MSCLGLHSWGRWKEIRRESIVNASSAVVMKGKGMLEGMHGRIVLTQERECHLCGKIQLRRESE